eukprot:INCI18237.1.p1 GENE.INCI18237.1~~INCI18237.1.p1  ORF type:complete len:1315 (+),score=227.64 INCI18237.1:176-4120(+)
MLNFVGAGACETATQSSTQNSDQLATPSQSPNKPSPVRLACRPSRKSRRRCLVPVRDLVLGGAAREVSFSEGPLGLRLAFKHDFDFGGITGNVGGDGVVVVGFRQANVGSSSPSIGQAEASGKVHLGDYVVGVDDVDVRGKTLAQVADLLQSRPRPLTVVFQSHGRADGHHERANEPFGQLTGSDEIDTETEHPTKVFVRRDAGIRLSQSQRRAMEAPPSPVFIEAGPGSGKTTVLVFRVWHMVQTLNVNPEHIAVLTFTNRAAREFQTRVEQLLTFHPMPDFDKGTDEGSDQNAVATVRGVAQSLGYVGTFHGFCLRLLRQRGPDVGVPARFVVASEPDLIDVVRELLLRFSVDACGVLSSTIRRVLDAVARGKKRAALILAQHDGDVPLATSQATQHAQGTSATTTSNRSSRLQQSINTAVARELSQLWPSGHNRAISRSFATAFNQQLRFMGCLDFGDLLFYGLAVLQLEQAEHEKLAVEQNSVGESCDSHKQDTQASSRSRPATARSLFRCVFVDEFQDVDEVQRAILRLFVRPHGNITAVGDFNQSIFNWTRLERDDQPIAVQSRSKSATVTDPRTKARWLRFLRDFGNASVLPSSIRGVSHSSQTSSSSLGTLILLRRNFRCTSHIEACANAVLSAPLCQVQEDTNRNDIVRSQQSEEPGAHDAESRREIPKAWKVVISSFQSGHEEASFAASVAGQALAATQPTSNTIDSGRCRVALLFRNNYQAPLLEDALANLELPFYHVQSKSQASMTPEVRDFLALLRVGVVNVSNYIAMRRVLRFALGNGIDNGTLKGRTAQAPVDPDAILRWILSSSGVENGNDDEVQRHVIRDSVDLVQALQRSVRGLVHSTGDVAHVSDIVDSSVSSKQCFPAGPAILDRLLNIATLLVDLRARGTLPAGELVPYLLQHPLFAAMLLRYCNAEEYRLRACWRNLLQLEGAAKRGRFQRYKGSGSNAVTTTELLDVFEYATTTDADDMTSGSVMKLKSVRNGARTSLIGDEDAEDSFQSSMWGDASSSLEEFSQQQRVPGSRYLSNMSVEDFLSETMSLSGGEQEEELQAGRGGVVALSTIHQAKGREWDVVVVVGLQEGTLPHHRRRSAQDLAEEQRLLYVAMTRARRQLVLSFVAKTVPRLLQTPLKGSSVLPSLATSSPTAESTSNSKLALPTGHCRWLSYLPKTRIHVVEEVMISGPLRAQENASENHRCTSHCEITPVSASTTGRGVVGAGTITPSKTKTLSAPQPVKRRQSWLKHAGNSRSLNDKLHPTVFEIGLAGDVIPEKRPRIDDTSATRTSNTRLLQRSSLLLRRHESV